MRFFIIFLIIAHISIFAQWQTTYPSLSQSGSINDIFYNSYSGTWWSVGGYNLIQTIGKDDHDWNIIERWTGNSRTNNSICFIDENVGFVTCEDYDDQCILYKTTDGGENWEENIFVSLEPFKGIRFFNSNIGIAWNKNKIYRSTDKCETWEIVLETNLELTGGIIYNETNASLYSNKYSDNSTILTFDQGKTWQVISPRFDFSQDPWYEFGTPYEEVEYYILSHRFFNPDMTIGFAVGSVKIGLQPFRTRLFKTSDGGNSWSVVGNKSEFMFENYYRLGVSFKDITFSNDLHYGIIVGRTDRWTEEYYGIVINSIDYGASWSTQFITEEYFSDEWTSAFNKVTMNDDLEAFALYSGPVGKSLYYCDNITVDVTQNTLPVTYVLKQNYPNPFNPTTTVDYQLQSASNVKLFVTDILGRLVHIYINEFQNQGYHSIKINAYDLSTGVYFYTLVTNDFIDTKKMIVLK